MLAFIIITIAISFLSASMLLASVSLWWNASKEKYNSLKALMLVTISLSVYGLWWAIVITTGVATMFEQAGIPIG